MPSTTNPPRRPRRHMNHTAAELKVLDDLLRRMHRSPIRLIADAAAAMGLETQPDTLSRRRRALGLAVPTPTEHATERQRALDDLIRDRLHFGPSELLAMALEAGIATRYKHVVNRRILLGGKPISSGQTAGEHTPTEPTEAEDKAIREAAAAMRRDGLAATLDDATRASARRRYSGPSTVEVPVPVAELVRPYLEEWRCRRGAQPRGRVA